MNRFQLLAITLAAAVHVAPVARAQQQQYAAALWEQDMTQEWPTVPVAFTYNPVNEEVLILENIAGCTWTYQYDCYYYAYYLMPGTPQNIPAGGFMLYAHVKFNI